MQFATRFVTPQQRWPAKRHGVGRATVVFGEGRSAYRATWATPRSPEHVEGETLDQNDREHTLENLLKLGATCQEDFERIDQLTARTLQRVQHAMKQEQVGPHHFSGSTGYGYGDLGRAAFDKVLAHVMGTEAAMCRISISGASHAAACALWACALPGTSILVVSGGLASKEVPIFRDLTVWGVSSFVVGLQSNGQLDIKAIDAALADIRPDVVFLQRGPQRFAPTVQDKCKQGDMHDAPGGHGRSLRSFAMQPAASGDGVEHPGDTGQPVQREAALSTKPGRGSSAGATCEDPRKNAPSTKRACCLQTWAHSHDVQARHRESKVRSEAEMADDPKITDSSSSSAGCSSSNGSGALPQARGVVSLQDIQNVVEVMRKHTMGTCHLVVDNSGAELLDVVESGTLDGVDLVSGSLFGVLGGGIVTEGGYVAGRSSMVEKACARLSAPGLSLDAGSVPGDAHRLLFQGLFLAPGLLSEILKGSIFLRKVFQSLGFQECTAPQSGLVNPITRITLPSLEAVKVLLNAIQSTACLDAHAIVREEVMEGCPVLVAGSDFVRGSEVEAWGIGRTEPPFEVALSGGSHWTVWCMILAKALPPLGQRQ